MIRPVDRSAVEAGKRTTLELGWLTMSSAQPPEQGLPENGSGGDAPLVPPQPPPAIPPPPSSGDWPAPPQPIPSAPVDVAVGRLPEATWRWWEALVVYVLATVVTSVVLVMMNAAGLIDIAANNGPAYVATLVVGELAFAGCVLFWVRVVHSSPATILGLPVEPMRDLAVGIPTGVGLYIVAFVVGVAVAYIYQAFTGHQPSSPDQVPLGVTGSWLWLTGIGVVFLAPFGEELLFRGMLFRGLRRSLSLWPAAIVSAALFSLGHLEGWSFLVLLPPLFCVGVGLALVYDRRQSLLASMSAHATFNLIGFLFIFTSRR
jgi:membrane protease YdiL (CAAX protease family)